MDFAKILAQLREELKNLDAAIQTLERLQQSSRRRSRPATESGAPEQEAPPTALKAAGGDRASGPRKTKRSDSTPT